MKMAYGRLNGADGQHKGNNQPAAIAQVARLRGDDAVCCDDNRAICVGDEAAWHGGRSLSIDWLPQVGYHIPSKRTEMMPAIPVVVVGSGSALLHSEASGASSSVPLDVAGEDLYEVEGLMDAVRISVSGSVPASNGVCSSGAGP